MERKSQHFSLVFMGVLFLALVGLTFWHTSLSFGEFRPDPAVASMAQPESPAVRSSN